LCHVRLVPCYLCPLHPWSMVWRHCYHGADHTEPYSSRSIQQGLWSVYEHSLSYTHTPSLIGIFQLHLVSSLACFRSEETKWEFGGYIFAVAICFVAITGLHLHQYISVSPPRLTLKERTIPHCIGCLIPVCPLPTVVWTETDLGFVHSVINHSLTLLVSVTRQTHDGSCVCAAACGANAADCHCIRPI